MGDFNYRPADLTVGRHSEVRVVNEGAVIHNWIVRGGGVGTAELRPGRSIIVDLRGIRPGTYIVFSTSPAMPRPARSAP